MNAQSQQGKDPNMHRDLKSAPTPKTRANQYPHNRKALADSILQQTEEEYAGPDLIPRGFRYLIGKTASGKGIALAWGQSRKSKPGQVLTHRILNAVLDEAKMAGLTLPIHIHASASTAPITEDLYHFHQLSHATMVRRGLADDIKEKTTEGRQ